MSWLSTLGDDGPLGEAVSLVNEALDSLERDGTGANAARCLSVALSGIQAEWSRLRAPQELDDAKAFQDMLARELSPETRAALLRSGEVTDVLRLQTETVTHDDEPEAGLLGRLAELVCLHHSNTAHGMDAPQDTGFERTERAETVSAVVIPVQLLLVNLLLDKPDERLVIYGTLAPGKPNHYVIEDLRGDYCDCSVHGRISEADGLPYFTWAPSADSLDAQLFSCRQLPEMWNELDRFEGEGYKRRLIPATTDDGLTIASIYLSTADD